MDEMENMLDSDEEIENYKQNLMERFSKYDTEDFKIADYLDAPESEEEFDVVEDAQEGDEGQVAGEDDHAVSGEEVEEEEFEENSKFEPKKEALFTRVMRDPYKDGLKFLEETDDSNDLKIHKSKFGSREAYKRSNENLYNLQHATKRDRLSKRDNNLEMLKEQAAATTRYRRDYFLKVQNEQRALPKEQQVPHYLDKNGMA
jgi:hypothetical protein